MSTTQTNLDLDTLPEVPEVEEITSAWKHMIQTVFSDEVIETTEKIAFEEISKLWEPRIRASKDVANRLHTEGEIELGELLSNKYNVIWQTIMLNWHDLNRFSWKEVIDWEDNLKEDIYLCVRNILQASAQADTLKSMKADWFQIRNEKFYETPVEWEDNKSLNNKQSRHLVEDRNEMFYRLMIRENTIRCFKWFDPLLNKEDAYNHGYSEIILQYGLMLRLNVVEHITVANREWEIVATIEKKTNWYDSEAQDEGKSLNPANQE